MTPPPQTPHDLVVFDPSMHVGEPVVDAQHRMLISELNRLIAATQAMPSSEVFSDGLSRLGRQLDAHFRFEEQLIRGLGMPADEIEAHVHSHSEILAQYTDLNLDLMRLKAVSRAEVLAMMQRWLVEHIVVHDASMRDYLPA
ncbi:bacteriohemerythrin [Ideonella sp. A 288]|uniref:bacteriohemerythrin n=1 Tax=Ideonella sp. A 288 TaxID=1962181 RepID=UPI001302F13B|nr:hemerythrin family protein [Ideonella sp. A 288]